MVHTDMFYNVHVGGMNFSIFVCLFVDGQIVKHLNILPFISIIVTLEFILTIISCAYAFINCYIIFKSSFFHANLRYILLELQFGCVATALARIPLVFYELNYLEIHDDFVSDLLLLLSSYMRCCSFAGSATVIPILVAERILATKFINDYEQKDRRYIFLGFLIFCAISSNIITVFIVRVLAIDVSTCLAVIVPFYLIATALSVAAAFFTFRFNKQWLHRLKTNFDAKGYALPIRFQLKENVRAFEWIMNFIKTAAVMNTLNCTLGSIAMCSDQNAAFTQIVMALFNLVCALFVLIIQLSLVYTVDEWKVHYDELIRRFLWQKKITVVQKQPANSINPAAETDMYFSLYKANW